MTVTPGLVPWMVLLAALACAVWTDCARRRIPNRLVLVALTLGLLWHLTGPAGAWSFDAGSPGAIGLTGFVFGAAGLLILLLPLYALRVLGGGDVKLLSAIGGLCGASLEHWGHLVGIVLAVLVAGGVLAVVRMVALGITLPVMAGVLRIAGAPLARRAGRGGPHVTADRMPYAVAIAVGTLGYLAVREMRWIA